MREEHARASNLKILEPVYAQQSSALLAASWLLSVFCIFVDVLVGDFRLTESTCTEEKSMVSRFDQWIMDKIYRSFLILTPILYLSLFLNTQKYELLPMNQRRS